LRDKISSRYRAQPSEEIQKPDPALFKAFSFGHLPSFIDTLTIRFVLDPSSTDEDPKLPSLEPHSESFYLLDLATDLDTSYFSLYFHGANYLAIVRNDAGGALKLLLKSELYRKEELPKMPSRFQEHYWSTPWSLLVTLAYVYLFEFEQIDKAASAFLDASTLPGAPAYLDRLAAQLKDPVGVYDVGLRLLNFMIQSAPKDDVKTREKLEWKRKHLFLNQYLFQLNEDFRRELSQNPEYAKSTQISKSFLEKAWKNFQKKFRLAPHEFLGGTLYLDSNGKIQTTSPRERILGLE
jgi:hypothetical protein